MAAVLFSAMQNDAPFLLEWIAYHRAIGFERIVITTGNARDQTPEMLDRLSAAGIIAHHRVEAPGAGALQAHVAGLSRDPAILADGDWALFLGVDEFLDVRTGDGRLADLLALVDGDDRLGMLINWRIFGDSGQPHFRGRYISDDYTGCDAGLHETKFRMLFRKGADAPGLSTGLQMCQLAPGGPDAAPVDAARILAPDGQGLDSRDWASAGPFAPGVAQWLAGSGAEFAFLPGHVDPAAPAQVNRYMVGDPHTFTRKTRQRGRSVLMGDRALRNTRFYHKWNRNEARDRSILRWQEATGAEMQALAELAGLDDLLDAARADYMQGQDRSLRDIEFHLTFPRDEAAFIRERYAASDLIFEYGSGGSTVLAARLGRPVVSVETDETYADGVAHALAREPERADLTEVLWVNLGQIAEWGYPRDNSRMRDFYLYPTRVWETHGDRLPDTVLVDGRMRMACFLATLALTRQPLTLLFDDYHARRKYSRVETLLKPVDKVGRMAVFDVTPGLVTMKDFGTFIPWFFDLD